MGERPQHRPEGGPWLSWLALAWPLHLWRSCSCQTPSLLPRRHPGLGDNGPWLTGKELRGPDLAQGLILLVFFFLNRFIYLFIYLIFWLCWVFIAAHGLSLVAASRGCSSLRCAGFSLWWLLLLRSTGSRRVGLSSCGSRALERRLRSCGSRA